MNDYSLTPCIAIYKNSALTVTYVTVDTTQIIVLYSNGDTSTVTYENKDIRSIVSELNIGTDKFIYKDLIHIGAEKMRAGSLSADNQNNDLSGDGAILIRYKSPIIKYKENTVLQLKPPGSIHRFLSWHASVGTGKIRARFSDIATTSYPGVNPEAIYTFGVNEYWRQDWSPRYGPPYKDVLGEIPATVRYSPNLSASVISVSNKPLYYRNKNISVKIGDVPQPNSAIRHVDENNGLIYLSTKINRGVSLSISYSYREDDYSYDAIDLNVATSHSPINVDSYVAYYIKPISSIGGFVSGGDSVFHEVVNTAIGSRSKVARVIPQTKGTNNPIYEPVIFLGAIQVRQAYDHSDVDIIDTRSRGGGIYPDKVGETPAVWREAEFLFDIGSLNGIEIPGNAAVVINVPTSRKKSTMPRDEIDARASKDVALGIVPIVEFDD